MTNYEKYTKPRRLLYRSKGLCDDCGKFPALEGKGNKCTKCSELHKARMRKIGKSQSFKRKMEAMNAYGGPICKCCGEERLAFMSLDHVNDDGYKYRNQGIMNTYWWAKKNGWPESIQILCHNCNQGRAVNGGICPHQIDLPYTIEYAL